MRYQCYTRRFCTGLCNSCHGILCAEYPLQDNSCLQACGLGPRIVAFEGCPNGTNTSSRVPGAILMWSLMLPHVALHSRSKDDVVNEPRTLCSTLLPAATQAAENPGPGLSAAGVATRSCGLRPAPSVLFLLLVLVKTTSYTRARSNHNCGDRLPRGLGRLLWCSACENLRSSVLLALA